MKTYSLTLSPSKRKCFQDFLERNGKRGKIIVKDAVMETLEKVEDMYHVYSDGMRTDSLFTDDTAFVAGMNATALCSLRCKVKILCFCLMDNHVHFILGGTRCECNAFIVRYRNWYARWRGGLEEDMRIGIKSIETKDYLLTAIAYVLRNPVAAGYPYIPGDYRWSSGSLYFREANCPPPDNEAISSIGLMKRRKIFFTRQDIPDDWTIDKAGMIWPGHYTAYRQVNDLYRHVRRYLYYLSATQEAALSESLGMTDMVILPEKELRRAAMDIVSEMFSKDSLKGLAVSDRLILAKRLRKQYGSSLKQIARVVHLDAHYLEALL